MNSLKLVMSKSHFDEFWYLESIIMDEFLQICRQYIEILMVRWHKKGIRKIGSTNPILTPSYLSWIFILSSHAREEHLMDIIEQAE